MSDNWHGWIDGVEFTSRESALKALGISEPAPAEQGEVWAGTLRRLFTEYIPEWDYHGNERGLLQAIWEAIIAARPQPKEPQAEASGEGAERTAITKEISNDN